MFAGLDVHKEFCQSAFGNAKRKVVKEAVFENTQDDLQKLFARYYADVDEIGA